MDSARGKSNNMVRIGLQAAHSSFVESRILELKSAEEWLSAPLLTKRLSQSGKKGRFITLRLSVNVSPN